MLPLPSWMRRALFATAAMNILVAAMFCMPSAESLRVLAGFPAGGDPFYLATIGLFIALFGLGYLWTAVAGSTARLFVGLGSLGKLSFFALVLGFWNAGMLPVRAPILASADLVFGALFLFWLLTARRGPGGPRPPDGDGGPRYW